MSPIHVILARKPSRSGNIVLVALFKGDERNATAGTTPDEFVTWWENDKGETFNGHYTLDLTKAVEEYDLRQG